MNLKMLADAFKAIMDREKAILNDSEVKHGPTIGDMYEGLTRSLLEGLGLAELGLKVVSGFMRAGSTRSGQLDCMVVMGEGEKLPYLERYVYPARQVLAVLEIKKNLYTDQFENAYGQLADVFRIATLDLELQEKDGSLEFSVLRPALEFMKVFKKRPPHYDERGFLPFHEKIVYQWLVKEHVAPLRIAIGYYGFKKHSSMRKVVGDFYEAGSDKSGARGLEMPNLVISEDTSILKTTGIPYSGDWHDEAGWLWLCSSEENPALLLLEFLFDQIERVLGVTINRGEDMHLEANKPLVSTFPALIESGVAVLYHTIVPADAGCGGNIEGQWSPYSLSLEEKELLELMAERGELSVHGKVVRSFVLRHSLVDIESFVERMLKCGVVLRTDNSLTVYPNVVIVKVLNELYCADNSGNRFAQWVNLRSDTLYGEGLFVAVGSPL
ncbi:hypothetical protein HX870_26615 [Pseudomonas gingeri]|uniref:DUF6602 domain-containing protein n=1 Tax=Pseudomonas gingeri TaxID=117681 RepID=UPI0015A0666F|nr:DUF6602 domain-containing protein [Pseudomonas gingeri]NWD71176.1 hypothetical protein [Pseudomonas gingeri]